MLHRGSPAASPTGDPRPTDADGSTPSPLWKSHERNTLSSHRPLISIITLGGTIASVPDAQGHDATPRLTPADLLASVPQAQQVADFRTTSFRQYPSGDLSVEDIVELARFIQAEAEAVDGVVITQGTDTLEETSYLLDLLLTTEVPVVLTGAMRNAGLPGADGAANLLAAIQVASAPEARSLGPLVVFADEIHLPRYVRKLHTASIGAFGSPNAGPIGWVNEGRVRIPLAPRQRFHPVDLKDLPERFPTVGIIKLGLGSAPLLPEHVTGFQGVVVEVFGGGHVPSSTVKSLVEVHQRMPLVLASRTGAGELYASTYAFPGSEKDVFGRGLISTGSLDGAKARLLLLLLVAAGRERAVIERTFRDLSSQLSSLPSSLRL